VSSAPRFKQSHVPCMKSNSLCVNHVGERKPTHPQNAFLTVICEESGRNSVTFTVRNIGWVIFAAFSSDDSPFIPGNKSKNAYKLFPAQTATNTNLLAVSATAHTMSGMISWRFSWRRQFTNLLRIVLVRVI
jgi:hypothetical protein